MILSPVIIKLLERFNLETLARLTAYCGYLWMAFVFLFFFTNITFDIARHAIRIIFQHDGGVMLKNIFLGLPVFLSVAFVIYGFFDARQIRVKHFEIHTGKPLPAGGTIRIVQISDVHIGLIVREKRLKEIVNRVQNTNPDILVSTGDLLDGEIDNVTSEAEQLANIKTTYGKFAVTGNHEYYAGIEKALDYTKKAGFEILRDESKRVAGINIIGLEDPTARQYGPAKRTGTSALFPDRQPGEFILLLKHQPTINEDRIFDLQLSGHTHGGQIFPFMFFTRLFFPITCGYHELNKGKAIYVSKGTGTWGPPVRFLAAPEITVIDLMQSPR